MKQGDFQALSEVLQQAINDGFIAGGNLLVLQNGKERFYCEAGMADTAAGVPIKRDTIFHLYSMSKPITSAAAMILMERGVIDLFDPVSKYIPEYKNQTVWTEKGPEPVHKELQIRDLLSMTSGMSYGEPLSEPGRQVQGVFNEAMDRMYTNDPMTTVEMAVRLSQTNARFHPGEEFKYGPSADILGAIIEIASGMRFGEFLKKELFDPLDMKDTGFYVPEEKQSRLSKIYVNGDVKEEYTGDHLAIQNKMKYVPTFESGGAGIVGTIDDYAHFATMLINGGAYNGKWILSKKTVEYMTSCHLTAQQQIFMDRDWPGLDGYSYGNLMRVLQDPGRTYYMTFEGEYGWDGWLGTYFFNAPQEKLTFLLMYQLTDTGTTPLARRLRNVLGAVL